MLGFPWFRRSPDRLAGEALYAVIVDRTRQPCFYSVGRVPDTFDGRFELLILHAGLLTRRLSPSGRRGASVSQALFDQLFLDMDQVLREQGVGDLTVPKKIRQMGEAFYGRARAYDTALMAQDRSELIGAIVRNVFRGQQLPGAEPLADYMFAAYALLQSQDTQDLCDGRVDFPDALAFFARGTTALGETVS